MAVRGGKGSSEGVKTRENDSGCCLLLLPLSSCPFPLSLHFCPQLPFLSLEVIKHHHSHALLTLSLSLDSPTCWAELSCVLLSPRPWNPIGASSPPPWPSSLCGVILLCCCSLCDSKSDPSRAPTDTNSICIRSSLHPFGFARAGSDGTRRRRRRWRGLLREGSCPCTAAYRG